MDRQIKHNLTGQHGYDRGMTDKPFLTIGEVADILQVNSRTVYNLIYKGTLRACRLTYHITIITREDFFLMIKETTYCKRSVSIFARQGKKTKKKMNEDTPNTEKDLSQKEGKKKAKGSPKRQLIPAANYKQSVRDTFTDKRVPEATFIRWLRFARNTIIPTGDFTISVCATRYPVSKPMPPSASRKPRLTRLWLRKRNGWEATCRNTGIPVSTSCACSVWARPKSAGSRSPTG